MSATLPLTNEQIQAWTPAQQLDALSRLAGVVMSGQKDRCLAIPPSEPERTAEGYFLTGYQVGLITSFSPAPDDADLWERNRIAADPRNRLAMSDELLDQIAD